MKEPFQTKESQDQLIDAYVNKADLYNGLIRCNSNDKVKGRCLVSDCNNFYVQVFNEWRQSLVILIEQDRVSDRYKERLYALFRYVQPLSPTTREEVLKIMDDESIQDPLLSDAMRIFRWNSIGEYTGWDHIHSNYVHFGLSEKQKITHRIYLNCDSTVVYKIARLFMKKCNERNSAYYFKFDSYGGRDDTIVFYCDSNHLETYISILKEIIQEEGLKQNIHQPPICTATIDGVLGYGTEPKAVDGEKTPTFNQKRANHLEDCIRKESNVWIIKNLETPVFSKEKTIPYQDLLFNCIVDETVKYYMNHTPNRRNCITYKGYTLDDLRNSNFRNYVYQYARRYYHMILRYYQNNEDNANIEFPFINGRLSFNKTILEEVRKKQVQFFWSQSSKFQKCLMDRIHSTSSQVGIDPDNYACDLYVVQELGKNIPNSTSQHESQSTSTNPLYCRKTKSGYIYRPMTDEEIEKTKQRLGL